MARAAEEKRRLDAGALRGAGGGDGRGDLAQRTRTRPPTAASWPTRRRRSGCPSGGQTSRWRSAESGRRPRPGDQAARGLEAARAAYDEAEHAAAAIGVGGRIAGGGPGARGSWSCAGEEIGAAGPGDGRAAQRTGRRWRRPWPEAARSAAPLRDAVEAVRDVLRKAGPEIARELVRRVSDRATEPLPGVAGRARRCRWSGARDYEIRCRIRAEEREFKQLSGGEQMAAALAVRLALLQTLSNLRLAFLDEPTAHMDAVAASEPGRPDPEPALLRPASGDLPRRLLRHPVRPRGAAGQARRRPRWLKSSGPDMLYARRRSGRRWRTACAAFREWDARHAQEIEAYAGALDRLAGMDAGGDRGAAGGQTASPGALPSEEHGSPLIIPLPATSGPATRRPGPGPSTAIQGITTLAVDGSQIPPSKDYSYGVAAIQVAWFENPHRGESRRLREGRPLRAAAPDLMLSPGEEGGGMTQEVNLRRFEAEVGEIVRHMREWGRTRRGRRWPSSTAPWWPPSPPPWRGNDPASPTWRRSWTCCGPPGSTGSPWSASWTPATPRTCAPCWPTWRASSPRRG